MHWPSRLSRKLQLVLIPLKTPVVALFTMAVWTCAGEAPGLVCRYRAAAPATCGVAIEVPDRVAVAVFDDGLADRMLTPGAWTSTQVPKFENEACALLMSVAPVSMPSLTRAGEPLQPL